MEQTMESTRAESDAPDMEDRQGMIHYYVDELMQRVVGRLYESIPQLFQYVTQWGPCVAPEEMLHLFGGRRVFIRTCQRMNLIRGAVLRGEMENAPVDLRRWMEMGRPGMGPPYRDYRDWWIPHMDSVHTFWHNVPEMDEEIVRYPTQTECNTDEYFQDSSGESWLTDADEEVKDDRSGSEDGRQPAQISGNEEVNEDGSDNEDWRRPPPINTMGLEWFYE